jgi:dTDP-4-amino-4,6-dideoxygalactose transaminase
MLPSELERKITSQTKAVIFVDALGNPTGLTEIKAICDKFQIPLIEDAACAIGSSENGVRCGSIADLTCYSFHPRKLISTGEGGAITTDRDDWAQWLETKLMHGASGMKGVGSDFVDYGYNFRLSELPAIMGLKQLKKIDSIIDERNVMRDLYQEQLEPHGYKIQKIGNDVRYNVQSLVFRVPEHVNRDRLIAYLKDNAIESTLGTYSLSATTYYQKRYADVQINSCKLNDITIALPCHSGLDVLKVTFFILNYKRS